VTSFDFVGEILEGALMTKAEADSLEHLLTDTPDDVDARAKLIGYYFCHYTCCEQAHLNRVQHIAWILKYLPAYDRDSSSFMSIDARDSDAYLKLENILKEQLAQYSDNAAVISNIAGIIRMYDPVQAESLYIRALEISPNDSWLKEQIQTLAENREIIARHVNPQVFKASSSDFASGDCDGSFSNKYKYFDKDTIKMLKKSSD
jgi:hypothetical protein